jgi:cytochrome c-type biogenesis protein CcmH
MFEIAGLSSQSACKPPWKKRAARYGFSFIPVLLAAVFSIGADTKSLEETEREIEDNLIAPCCWSQPVSKHPSEASDQIRQEVHAMLAAGKSRDEIFDYYVAKYGEKILAAPRARGFNALVYILPWAALALGVWFVITLLRKLRSPAPAPFADLPPAPYASYATRIEKELRDLDE